MELKRKLKGSKLYSSFKIFWNIEIAENIFKKCISISLQVCNKNLLLGI